MMMMNGPETHYFDCECESVEHTIRFVCDEYEPDDKELFVEVQLMQHRSFVKRLWVALRYVFGYQCKYGHWDTTTFKQEDLVKLQELAERAKHVKSKESV